MGRSTGTVTDFADFADKAWAVFAADITPQWALVVLTALGAWLAYRAFNEERNAVRLTQRADVLLDTFTIEPSTLPLTPDTKITLIFKNYGPTRASNVRFTTELVVRGVTSKKPANTEGMPATMIAARDQVSVTFDRLGHLFEASTLLEVSKARLPFFFEATVRYVDVFGMEHRTTCSGRYFGPAGFIVERNNDAN